MPQRVYGIAIAVTGLFFVIFLLLLRFDLRRAAKTGPQWKRNLVLAGIFTLSTMGLVSCSDGGRQDYGGVPAASAKNIEDASEWKHVDAVWREAAEIASGERGEYPFDEDGKKRILFELSSLRKDILGLEEYGLVGEAEAELLRIELAALVREVSRKRPAGMEQSTCYIPAPLPAMGNPAKESAERLAERLPLLAKLAKSGRLRQNVLEKLLATVAQDFRILENGVNLVVLPQAERQAVTDFRESVRTVLAQLERAGIKLPPGINCQPPFKYPPGMKYPPGRELPPDFGRTCYMIIPVDPDEKGGSDIKKQLELMKGLAESGRIRPEVAEKVLRSLENRAGAQTALSEIRKLLEG